MAAYRYWEMYLLCNCTLYGIVVAIGCISRSFLSLLSYETERGTCPQQCNVNLKHTCCNLHMYSMMSAHINLVVLCREH